MRFLAASRLCAMVTGLVAIGPMANAGAPMPVGKRAMLSLSIQIDGAGQHASKSDGVDVKWSAHRTFDTKVELAAEKASSTSVGDVKGQVAAAAHLSTDMQALQKQAKQCQPDDMACQMELAAKMMETDDAKKMVQQAQAAQGAPDRYQSWKAPAKAGRVEVRADSMDQWDGVFLTGSREERHCKISGVYPGGNAAAAAKNRETMEGGVKGLQVAVDTQTGKSWLTLVIAAYTNGEQTCHINDGGKLYDERDAKVVSFSVPIDINATGGWVEGAAAAGAAIARGEMDFQTKPDTRGIDGQSGSMSVTAPLKVKVRWELTPL